MKPNINDYISTLLNPNGMFRSLGNNISPCLTDKGEVDFWVEARIMHIRVSINATNHVIWCFLGDRATAKKRYQKLTKQFEAVESDFIYKWSFLQNEMLVLDDHDNHCWCDILIQSQSDAISVHQYLLENTLNENRKAFTQLIKGLSLLAEDMLIRGIDFNGVDLYSMSIREDALPVLSPNYRARIIVNRDDFLQEGVLEADNRNFALFGAVLFMLSVEPLLFLKLGLSNSFNEEAFSKVTPIVRAFADLIMLEALVELIDLADQNTKGVRENRKRISNCLHILSNLDVLELRDRFHNLLEESSPLHKAIYGSNQQEDLLRITNAEGLFCYISLDTGQDVFGKSFREALEFDHHRAVVSTDGKLFGLLDTQGNYIVEQIYDDVVWCAEANLIITEKDGLFRLLNKDGRALSYNIYQEVGLWSEGLLAVCKDGKYGYVNQQDELVIDFLYDKAESFCKGEALVLKNGQWGKIYK